MPVTDESWNVAPNCLTVREAAMLLGMQESVVQAMMNTLEVETCPGDTGRVLVSKDSLRQWCKTMDRPVDEKTVDPYRGWREKTWSVPEAAEHIPGGEVSTWMIKMLCRAGAFGDGPEGAFRVGRRWRISKEALRKYQHPVYHRGRHRKGYVKAEEEEARRDG